MNAPAQTTVRTRNHVLAANNLGEMDNSIGHKLGVFENVGCMTDYPGD